MSFLIFADDTTLMAKSRHALQIMIGDISRALAEIGLMINPDKCKIQMSCCRSRKKVLAVQDSTFPIVRSTVH